MKRFLAGLGLSWLIWSCLILTNTFISMSFGNFVIWTLLIILGSQLLVHFYDK